MIIAALIGGEVYGEPVYAMAIGVVVGGFLQFVTQIPAVRRVGFRWQPDFGAGPAVKKVSGVIRPNHAWGWSPSIERPYLSGNRLGYWGWCGVILPIFKSVAV